MIVEYFLLNSFSDSDNWRLTKLTLALGLVFYNFTKSDQFFDFSIKLHFNAAVVMQFLLVLVSHNRWLKVFNWSLEGERGHQMFAAVLAVDLSVSSTELPFVLLNWDTATQIFPNKWKVRIKLLLEYIWENKPDESIDSCFCNTLQGNSAARINVYYLSIALVKHPLVWLVVPSGSVKTNKCLHGNRGKRLPSSSKSGIPQNTDMLCLAL